MLEQLKEKIAAIEDQIKQVMANHSYLAGALAALKEAVALGEAVAPQSDAVKDLQEAENMAEAVENAVEPASE